MGGSSGGIIVRDDIKDMLNKPQVSGVIPEGSRSDLATIMNKDTARWTDVEVDHVINVVRWLMKHKTATDGDAT